MRPRATILLKLLVAFAAPTLALFALFAFLAYDVTERDLDGELGLRMSSIAASAAAQITPKYLNGNPETEKIEAGKLARLADATGAHLFVLDRGFATRLDSDPDVTIGAPDYAAQLDRLEIGGVWDDGAAIASEVTFEGDDGKQHKAGYAAVKHADGTTAFVVGAEAPAGYFDRLDHLRARLFEWGAGLAAVVLLSSILVTVLITRPVRQLAAAAEQIGKGDLDAPVRVRSHDEIGLLAETMERMRTQLRERDARMQQMLAGIAHEVRNPLAGMTLFTGILKDELPDGDERRGHVDKIARELGYLERVVHDFLDYARRPPLERAPTALRPLLDEVAELAGGEIEVSGEGEANVDRAQLRRALINLAQNAKQAGDRVRLAVRRGREKTIEIDVTNRGAAIPDDARARIFEPFFTTREKGTGLGLAFVREIARDHGGDVTVTCDGGETRFRVTLPA